MELPAAEKKAEVDEKESPWKECGFDTWFIEIGSGKDSKANDHNAKGEFSRKRGGK